MLSKIPPEVISALIICLGTILSGLAAWVTKTVVDWLSSKTAKNLSEKTNAELKQFLDLAADAVNKAVATVLADYVEKVKCTADWDEESKEIAVQMAIVAAQDQMGPEATEAIGKFVNPDGSTGKTVDDWIRPRIATALEKARLEKAERIIAEGKAAEVAALVTDIECQNRTETDVPVEHTMPETN